MPTFCACAFVTEINLYFCITRTFRAVHKYRIRETGRPLRSAPRESRRGGENIWRYGDTPRCGLLASVRLRNAEVLCPSAEISAKAFSATGQLSTRRPYIPCPTDAATQRPRAIETRTHYVLISLLRLFAAAVLASYCPVQSHGCTKESGGASTTLSVLRRNQLPRTGVPLNATSMYVFLAFYAEERGDPKCPSAAYPVPQRP